MAGAFSVAGVLLFVLSACAAFSAYDLVPPLALDARLNYDFKGSTMVSRNYVKLTGSDRDQRGHIVSNAQGLLPENFEVTMEFQVGGGGRNMYGDGMVLWLLENEPQSGGMFGLSEYYNGLAVAIDTYRNGPGGRVFPRMVIMKNDGTHPYDKDHDGNQNEIGGCSMRGLHDNRRQDYSSVRVSYSKPKQMMTVEVNFRNGWEMCDFEHIDLGPLTRIAVSAATGELVEKHVVKELRLEDYGAQVPPSVAAKLQDRLERTQRNSDGARTNKKQRGSSRPSAVGRFFRFVGRTLWLLFKIAICAFVAFKAYQYVQKYRQQREDNKYKLS